MELSATYIYRSKDMCIHSKLLIPVGEAMKGYNKANNKAKSELNLKNKKKKDTSRKYGLLILNIFLKKKNLSKNSSNFMQIN